MSCTSCARAANPLGPDRVSRGLTPLIARIIDTLVPGSLPAPRLPAALAVRLTVVLTC